MPLDTRIALGVQPLQVPDPLAQYGQVQNILAAQTQRQTGQLHAQQLQFQMDQAKEAQDAIGQIMGAVQEHGGPSDPMVAAMQMLQHRNPTVQATGRHLMDSAQILRAYQSDKAFAERGRQPPLPVTAEPSATGLPAYDRTSDSLANRQNVVEAGVKAQAPFIETRNLPARGVELPPATQIPNQLAPAPVAPVNQLATPVSKVDQIDAEIADLMRPEYMYSPQAKARIEFLTKRRDQLTKAHVVGPNLVTEEGKEIYRSPEKPLTQTELVRNFEYAKTPAGGNYRGSFAEFKAISTPKTSVTYGPQEKAEKIEYGKLLIDDFKNIKAQATIALKSLPAIESNLAILDKGFDTGFGTETIAAGARVLGALGVKEADKYATDAQSFLASANAAVLQRQLEQKGPQTESDAQRISATGAQLGNTKDANRFVLTVAKAQLQRDLAQRNFYAAWREKNGTFEGAEDAWYAGAGGKSLFDTPALKKYAAPTNTTVAPVKDNRPPLTEIFKNN